MTLKEIQEEVKKELDNHCLTASFDDKCGDVGVANLKSFLSTAISQAISRYHESMIENVKILPKNNVFDWNSCRQAIIDHYEKFTKGV